MLQKSVKYLLITAMVILTTVYHTSAQTFFKNHYKDRFFTAAIGAGYNGYFGELNYNNNIRRGVRNVTASLEARLLDRVSARSEFTYFTVSGADRFAPDSTFERQRNLSFQSRNFEMNLQALIYLNGYPEDFRKRATWDPYLALGVGVMRYNPSTILDDETIFLRDIQTEGVAYGNYALVLPVGIGVKARITKFLNVVFEAGYRFTFTDYLDDVSGDFQQFEDNTLQQRLSNRKDEIPIVNSEAFDLLVPGEARGDASNNDAYLMLNFKLEYYLPWLINGK